MKDLHRSPSFRSQPPSHAYAGLLLALLCLPPCQLRLPLQHMLVSAEPAQHVTPGGAGLRRGHGHGQGGEGSAIQSQLKRREAADALLHHWKDRSSFADVTNKMGSEEIATGRRTRNLAAEAAASRDDHWKSSHRDTYDNNDEQHRRRRLSSKKSSKNKHDEEEDKYGDQWMLDMIGGSAEYTFGSNHIYNAYTLDDKYVDKKEEETNNSDDDEDPVFTTDGDDGTNRDGLHFMAPRSYEAPLHVDETETTMMKPTSCNPTDFVLPPSVQQAATAAQFPGPVHIFATVAALQGGFSPALRQYETPLVLRFTRLIDLLDWNCAASFSKDWRDALTFDHPLVRVPSNANVTSDNNAETSSFDLHTSDSRLLCMVHAWTAVTRFWIPEAVHPLFDVLNMLGLGQDIGIDLDFDPDVDRCFDIAGMQTAWDDKEEGLLHTQQGIDAGCLRRVARRHCYSPRIVGKIVARQIHQYALYDGWNMDGTYDADGMRCKANCRAYTDPNHYRPNGNDKRWHPLMEDNGRGFKAYQQHVVPHIGTSAKRALLSTEEYEGKDRELDDPKYDYDDEAVRVIERLRTLTDAEKAMIEFFDDKLDVAFVVIGAVARLGASFEQILNYVVGLTASEHDALLLAWKEKVRHDLVRPTTWINRKMDKDEITTWAGPYQGVKTFEGKYFDAYVRVMPHSEFPSGSACICGALAEYTDQWLDVFGQDLLFPPPLNSTSIPIHVPTILKGSSRTEPGMTPAADLTVTYANLQELAKACGESRLDGGMHFERSVEASYELCDGVGSLGAIYASHLVNNKW